MKLDIFFVQYFTKDRCFSATVFANGVKEVLDVLRRYHFDDPFMIKTIVRFESEKPQIVNLDSSPRYENSL
jgi:hypothetical protein